MMTVRLGRKLEKGGECLIISRFSDTKYGLVLVHTKVRTNNHALPDVRFRPSWFQTWSDLFKLPRCVMY